MDTDYSGWYMPASPVGMELKNMTAREWLGKYKKLEQQIEQCYERIKSSSERARAVTPKYSKSPGGGSDPHKLDRHAVTIDMQQRRIAKLQAEQLKIEAAIDAVPNEDHGTALRYRYIMGWEINRIAAKMNYERHSIRRFIIEGEAAVEKIISEKDKDVPPCSIRQ